MRTLPLIQELITGTLELTCAQVRMISDDLAKALGGAAAGMLWRGSWRKRQGSQQANSSQSPHTSCRATMPLNSIATTTLPSSMPTTHQRVCRC